MKKKLWKNGLVVVTGVLLLIVMLTSYTTAATPRKGGTFKYSTRGEPATLNYMMSIGLPVITYSHLVFHGLVMVDPTQEEVSLEKLVPALAERWDISPDGKTYTFYLRKGVKFHDGHPFTAKDVKYSLDFYADTAKSEMATMVQMLDRVEIVDDHTIKAYLQYPYPLFLLYVSYPYCVMLPAHRADVSPKSTDFLVGTGPFKFKKRVPGKVWIYERNPDYFFKGLPYFDRVEIYPLKWPPAHDAFCAGQLDMCGNFRYGPEAAAGIMGVKRLKKYVPDVKVRLKWVPASRNLYFNHAGIKGHKGPWQDLRVRQAMALGIDWPGVIKASLGSTELGMNSGVVPSGVPTGLSWDEVKKLMGFDKPMEQRIKQAKKLLKEAGYPDGFKVTLISKGSPSYKRMGEYIVSRWRENLNLQADLNVMKNAVYYPSRDAGDFEVILSGMSGKFGAAPEETLGSSVTGGIGNYGRWHNPEFDKLFNKLLRETDPKEKEKISVNMQRIFTKEVVYVPCYIPMPGQAYRPTLRGVVLHPGMTHWPCIDRIWKEK